MPSSSGVSLCAGCSARAATLQDLDLLPGRNGHWRLDEGAGTTASDSSGSGNHGTLVNGPAWTAGRLGRALSLDGVNDYVTVPDSASLRPSSISVALWVYLLSDPNCDGNNNWRYFVYKDAWGKGYWLILEDDRTLSWSVGVSGSDKWVFPGVPSRIPLSQWTHIAATYDAGSGLLRLFVDGGLVGSLSTSPGSITYPSPAGALRLGGTNLVSCPTGSGTANAKYDDVRGYNRALGQEEVSARAGGLGAYWKLDDGSGTVATDRSGSGGNGTLTNGPAWTGGRLGGALSFDGVNDYVQAPSSPLYNPAQFTVSFWMYPRTVGGNNPPGTGSSTLVVSNGALSTEGSNWWFEYWNSGTFQFKSCTPTCSGASTSVTTIDRWYFVTGVYDGSAYHLYIDGHPVASGSGGVGSGAKSLLMGSGLCGAGAGCDSGYFNGVLDDVRFYSRALAPGEVSDLHKAYTETYTYNAIGNITSRNGAAYTYGSGRPHAVTQAGATAYTYDANGNMTGRGAQALAWDAEDRLASVSQGGSPLESYTYAGDGVRVKKVAGGQTTVYVNRYYQVAGATVTKYYYLGERLVAVSEGGTLRSLHQDHLGSSSVATDGAGAAVGSMTYYPFGETRTASGTFGTDKKFTGQRLDGTGLYFYNARYYDAGLGRFISPDTLVQAPSNPQSLNRYSYTLNNLLRYADPSGSCYGPFEGVRSFGAGGRACAQVDRAVAQVEALAVDAGRATVASGKAVASAYVQGERLRVEAGTLVAQGQAHLAVHAVEAAAWAVGVTEVQTVYPKSSGGRPLRVVVAKEHGLMEKVIDVVGGEDTAAIAVGRPVDVIARGRLYPELAEHEGQHVAEQDAYTPAIWHAAYQLEYWARALWYGDPELAYRHHSAEYRARAAAGQGQPSTSAKPAWYWSYILLPPIASAWYSNAK